MEEKVVLDSIMDIESVIFSINKKQKKIEFWKQLKKKRVSDIDEAISKLENQIGREKEIIQNTLVENDEKSLDFPGVGKVIRKKTSTPFSIVDKQALIDMFKDTDTGIVESKEEVKYSVNKKALKDYLKYNSVDANVIQTNDDVYVLQINIDKNIDSVSIESEEDVEDTSSASDYSGEIFDSII